MSLLGVPFTDTVTCSDECLSEFSDIGDVEQSQHALMHLHVTVYYRSISALVDTGSSMNILSRSFAIYMQFHY